MTLESQAADPAQKTEALRHQVEETRSDLVEKLESLEHHVVDMVQEAAESVGDTLASVKKSMGQTVDAVHAAVQGSVNSVTHALDIRHHVRQSPWLVLGAAFVFGFGCGRFLARP